MSEDLALLVLSFQSLFVNYNRMSIAQKETQGHLSPFTVSTPMPSLSFYDTEKAKQFIVSSLKERGLTDFSLDVRAGPKGQELVLTALPAPAQIPSIDLKNGLKAIERKELVDKPKDSSEYQQAFARFVSTLSEEFSYIKDPKQMESLITSLSKVFDNFIQGRGGQYATLFDYMLNAPKEFTTLSIVDGSFICNYELHPPAEVVNTSVTSNMQDKEGMQEAKSQPKEIRKISLSKAEPIKIQLHPSQDSASALNQGQKEGEGKEENPAEKEGMQEGKLQPNDKIQPSSQQDSASALNQGKKKEESKQETPADKEGVYTAKSKDNVWKILKKEYGMTDNEIANVLSGKEKGMQVLVNGKIPKSYSKIKPGDEIQVVSLSQGSASVVLPRKQKEESKHKKPAEENAQALNPQALGAFSGDLGVMLGVQEDKLQPKGKIQPISLSKIKPIKIQLIPSYQDSASAFNQGQKEGEGKEENPAEKEGIQEAKLQPNDKIQPSSQQDSASINRPRKQKEESKQENLSEENAQAQKEEEEENPAEDNSQ
jgi:hypothetical protein